MLKKIPKIITINPHLDKTARLQTVNKIQNNKYYKLLLEIEKITGFPIVLNTSFNIKGQPIVETPLDAISTYYSTGMDCLFIENFFLEKSNLSLYNLETILLRMIYIFQTTILLLVAHRPNLFLASILNC